jgi:DNA-directed RNA polymerase subunit RPC12/RpoP
MPTKNIRRHWSDDDSDLPHIERISRRYERDPFAEPAPRHKPLFQDNAAFKCCRCKAWVESDPEVCGVKHRNHCPYCLFSRHLDNVKAGDRRSDCLAAMRPIGLTLKHSHNKYAADDGELMLIHQCLGCGKLSINRIAADDNAEVLLAVFNNRPGIDENIRQNIASQGIHLLESGDLNIVLTRLLGKGESMPQWLLIEQLKLDID